MPRGSGPTGIRVAEYSGESGWFGARKAAVAVVQNYSDGLPEPCGGKNQINGVISIDVTRFDAQATGWRDKLQGLPPGDGELKLNPVRARAGGVVATLNAGQVGALIAVKIGDGDR